MSWWAWTLIAAGALVLGLIAGGAAVLLYMGKGLWG